MKILLTWFPLMDPGGLINHMEDLGVALKQMGHHVEFVSLEWKERIGKVSDEPRNTMGVFGYTFDQRYGWRFPADKRIPYKGKENMERWKAYASKFDIVVWEIPVPPANASNKGNMDWPELYNLPRSVRQQTVVHDGNLIAYAHLLRVLPHISSVGTTHECAYRQVAALGIQRFLINSPQNTSDMTPLVKGWWKKRPRRWLSVQTFKRWKRVDDTIRAVPHMSEETEGVLAGGGIEYFYLTSPDKTKPMYRNADGQRIWDVAIDYGMRYAGWITNTQRDAVLERSRLLIDASWSKKYAKSGSHYNRVSSEALKRGTLPVVRTHGTIAEDNGQGLFFKDKVNCIAIPWNATPEEFAGMVEDAMDLRTSQAEDMIMAGRAMLVKDFDRVVAATHMVNNACGKVTGAGGLCAPATGKPSAEMRKACDHILRTHFMDMGDIL